MNLPARNELEQRVTDALVVVVRYFYDPVSKHWCAVAEELGLRVRGITNQQARRRISKALRLRVGEAVTLCEEVELPSPVREEVALYHDRHTQWLDLDSTIRRSRAELATKLLQHRLSLPHVAALLRLTLAQLAVVLRKDLGA